MDISITGSTLLPFLVYGGLLLRQIHHPDYQWAQILLLIVLIFSAYWFNLITLVSLPFILLLFLLSLSVALSPENKKPVIVLPLGLLALLFALHVIPGFQYPILFASNTLGTSYQPFELTGKLDKALAAVALLIALARPHQFHTSTKEALLILISLTTFFLLAILMGAEFDPKFGKLTLAFIFFNLVVTCVAEEAFFRLILQNEINRLTQNFLQGWFAIICTGILFMLAHFHVDEFAVKRLFLVFIAGLLYGFVYSYRRSLGSAILMHFGINIIHFSFFAYPATFL